MSTIFPIKTIIQAKLKKLLVSGPRVAKIVHTWAAGKIFLQNYDSSLSLH